MNKNTKRGFTLAEIMVLLLIIAIVLAASAPIITKRTIRTAGGKANNPWSWVGTTSNAKFNEDGDNAAAIIGTNKSPSDTTPRLLINTNVNNTDHLNFYQNGVKKGGLAFNQRGFFLGLYPAQDAYYTTEIMGNSMLINNIENTVAIGNIHKYNSNSVAIGNNVSAGGINSISIGNQANAALTNSIAIGNGATANATNSIALGLNSIASGANSIAIGINSNASVINSFAIGFNSSVFAHNSSYSANNSIVIGNNSNFSSVENAILIGTNKHFVNVMTAYSRNYSPIPYAANNGTTITNIEGTFYFDNKIIIGNPAIIYSEAIAKNGIIANKVQANNMYTWYMQASGTNLPSDIRLKNLESEYLFGMDKLNKLKIYNYTFKNDPKKKRIGIVAQELIKIFPDAVSKGPDGYYEIRQEDIFYAMVNALKDFDKKIKNLAVNIANLNKDFDSLESEIKVLSNQTEKNSEEIKNLKQKIKTLELKANSTKGNN